MRYNLLCTSKCSIGLINSQFHRHILKRHVSAGLGQWDEKLDSEIKHKIELYWKDKVNVKNHVSNEKKDKFYVLSMFPYPSGSLHMGHVRVYTISDSISRFYKMKGKDVIHPMGWDAFGLPAENAAIERGIEPAVWTKDNILKMRTQLNKLGCSFDWECELATCDPEYYKWTQELFLKLYENGLLYQRESFVNWDPVDQTVLADEQVDGNNRSWRSGAKVEKRLLNQWFVKTTSFAKSLYENMNDSILKEWRDIIKVQKAWIGECTGVNFDFEIISDSTELPKFMTLWTEKPEFIENVKFIVVSKSNLISSIDKSNNYQNSIRILDTCVRNPFTNSKIPIFLIDDWEFAPFRNDYVGIPCASEKDAEFCRSMGIDFEIDISSCEDRENKRQEMMQKAKERNIGGYPVSSRLKDWLISRQRYWGTPIPIVHCKKCGVQPVPRSELPVLLPKSPDMKNEWAKTKCKNCGGPAIREMDTMDTFVDSSWYFMRYIDSKNKEEMFSKQKAMDNLPVDLYIGGKEHAVLHLYYARFINHFLHSLGLVPTQEPFKQLLVQGVVMGLSHRSKESGKYLRPNEVEKVDAENYVEKDTKKPVKSVWEKMSKSKFNGVDPLDVINNFSTDSTRLLMLADFAPTSYRIWSEETFAGILHWQTRLYQLVGQFIRFRNSLTAEELSKPPSDSKFVEHDEYMFDSRNFYVKGVTFNFVGSQQLSVAISKMQGLTNSINKTSKECKARSREFERALSVQIIMLAPLAPHFASELWAGFCKAPHRLVTNGEIQWDKDVLEQRWPDVDMTYKMQLRVFINNLKFMILRVPRVELDVMTEEEAKALVLKESQILDYIGDRAILNFKFISEKGFDADFRITTEKKTKKLALQKAV